MIISFLSVWQFKLHKDGATYPPPPHASTFTAQFLFLCPTKFYWVVAGRRQSSFCFNAFYANLAISSCWTWKKLFCCMISLFAFWGWDEEWREWCYMLNVLYDKLMVLGMAFFFFHSVLSMVGFPEYFLFGLFYLTFVHLYPCIYFLPWEAFICWLGILVRLLTDVGISHSLCGLSCWSIARWQHKCFYIFRAHQLSFWC